MRDKAADEAIMKLVAEIKSLGPQVDKRIEFFAEKQKRFLGLVEHSGATDSEIDLAFTHATAAYEASLDVQIYKGKLVRDLARLRRGGQLSLPAPDKTKAEGRKNDDPSIINRGKSPNAPRSLKDGEDA